jgi:hypothetical protein
MGRVLWGKLIIAGMVVFGAMIVLATVSHAQLMPFTPYEDFKGEKVEPERWRGHESFEGFPNPNRDARRTLKQGELVLSLTTSGETDSDVGKMRGRFGLEITRPIIVTAMQADVNIEDAVAQLCSGHLTASIARAQVVGAFFNDGWSTGPDDQTGDIIAGIQKQHDTDGDTVVAFIKRCTDADCESTLLVASHTFVNTWKRKHTDTLRLQWDPTTFEFHFTVNPGTITEEYIVLSSYPYFPNAPGPGLDFKRLQVTNDAVNCTEGRRETSMGVFFDNVQINVGHN